MGTLTLLDGENRVLVEALDDEIEPEVLGWHLRAEGLCRGDVCVPLRGTRSHEGRLPVGELASLLGRPVVVDHHRGVAAIGESAAVVGESMATLVAPDFTLPGPNGESVSLHDFDRRKRLLLAWSSW